MSDPFFRLPSASSPLLPTCVKLKWISRSRTFPPERLCISPGKSVWALYIDVVCINYDGNAFDAAVLAVMAALRNSGLTF